MDRRENFHERLLSNKEAFYSELKLKEISHEEKSA